MTKNAALVLNLATVEKIKKGGGGEVKPVFSLAAGLLTLVLVTDGAQRILTPKYVSQAQDGRLVAEYYASAQNHDVVFVGDCEVYENISPVTLWQEYGISTYVRGSPQQLIWHSYYLMEDTLRYEKPKAFVYNVYAMRYDTPQSEPYNRLALDGMAWSEVKSEAVKASMTKEESYLSYVFPLLRYHSRWSELTAEDFVYAYAQPPQLSVNGFLMHTGVDGVETLSQDIDGFEEPISQICWEYLDKMRLLCAQHGVEFILMKAPTNTKKYNWYASWDEAVAAYAKKHGLRYYNFLQHIDGIGLDYTTDTYDQGAHLNLAGAEKLSVYIGNLLRHEVGLADRRGQAAYETVWAELAQVYAQKKEQNQRI